MNRKQENALWRHAKSFGLPNSLVVPLVNDFLKWENSSGMEFAISRFKAMKTNLLRVVAGLEPVWEQGQYPTRGISWYKGLVNKSLNDRVWLSKALSLLNIYTVCYLSSVSTLQMKKFLSGVGAVPNYKGSAKFEGRLLTVASGLPRPPELKPARWIMDKPWSSSRRTPSVKVNGEIDYFVTRSEMGGVYDSILTLLTATKGADIIDIWTYFPNTVGATLGQLDYWQNASLVSNLSKLVGNAKLPLMGGTISFIQEAGGKLRSVANPYRWWQTALDSLAESLLSYLPTLPWDCTHDQFRGIPFVQKSLNKGQKWYSVDLSSATDHFPLGLQVEVLKQLYQGDALASEYIELFELVSRLPWWYHDQQGELQTIKWSKGQPLGLRPSFASFALTHGLVLFTLLQGKPYTGQFFVLGDDVIIGDEDLYAKYRNFLRLYDIPVSEAKTLEGSAAEFASLLILPDTVVPIYKWRGSTPDNFVDLARLWGPSSLCLFRKEEQEVLTQLRSIPPMYGGLGWGDPSKWDYNYPKWMDIDKGLKTEMSNLRHYMRQVYTSDSVAQASIVPKVKPNEIGLNKDKLKSLVQSHFGFEVNDDTILESMISNLEVITSTGLPIPDWDGSPKSSLSVWKDRLGLN